ncbi:hypothetical protein DP42_4737 [Burkholderia pseudomallei]|nr:hypothetical protein DP42_4737 [Burkholderia pseudomallei]
MPGLVRCRLLTRARIVTMHCSKSEQLLSGGSLPGAGKPMCVVDGIHAASVAEGAR